MIVMRRGGGRIRRGRRGSIGTGVGGRGGIIEREVGVGGRGTAGMAGTRMENVVMVGIVILVGAGVGVPRDVRGRTRGPGAEAGHEAGAGAIVEPPITPKLALGIRVRSEPSVDKIFLAIDACMKGVVGKMQKLWNMKHCLSNSLSYREE